LVGAAPGDFTNVLVAEYRPGTPLGWHRDVPAYVLSADARWRWQHGIAPTTEHRWSITFRTPRVR